MISSAAAGVTSMISWFLVGREFYADLAILARDRYAFGVGFGQKFALPARIAHHRSRSVGCGSHAVLDAYPTVISLLRVPVLRFRPWRIWMHAASYDRGTLALLGVPCSMRP